MSSEHPQDVFRRKVFYLPGYDPFPPRRYRELYRKESAAQAQISGYDIALVGRLPGEGFGWQVVSTMDEQTVSTDIEVLIWSDLVQQSRPKTVHQTYLGLVRTAWIYISTGALFRLVRLRKGPVIAALYPVVALMAQLLVAGLVGALCISVVGWVGRSVDMNLTWLAVLLAMVVFWRVLAWFKARDGRFFAYYLMHDFAYSSAQYGAYPDALEHRLHAFREKVAAALESDVDEVLVVGHSSGAHLAISMLADLIRSHDLNTACAQLGFLSLGHVVPMLSFLPHAERLRGDLRYLSTRPELSWVDVSAPGDGCCFALCDPVAVSGQRTDKSLGPLVFSAAFTQSLSPEHWRALRWRFFRLHFQYLCAFDRPKDYDYFQITAGPLTLAERYAGRVSSKSRLSETVSKYTSVRP